MIDVAATSEYLTHLLVEEDVADDVRAFPEAVRRRAIREAAIAIASMHPHAAAVAVDVPFDADSGAFLLGDGLDRILSVVALVTPEGRRNLKLQSFEAMDATDPCWWQRTDEPLYALWTSNAPRYLWVPGADPVDRVAVIAARAPDASLADGDVDSDTLALDTVYLPAIVDFALHRLLQREDTAAGVRAERLQAFEARLVMIARVHDAMTPFAGARGVR